MDLVCPKCQGSMRTYERNGVHVDQCSECRGIFLDRGELERLMDAEASWNASASQPAAAPAPQPSHQTPSHQAGQPYQPAPSGHSPSQSTGQAASLAAVAGEVLRQVRSSSSSSHGSQYGHKQKSHKKSFLNELFG
jgi:hypothetical protein